MNERLNRLRLAMATHDLDAMFVIQPENRRYLSGFSGSAGILIITKDVARLATDFRYYEQVGQQAPDFELVPVVAQTPPVLAEQVAALGLRRVGIERHAVTLELYDQWREAMPQVEWVPISGMVEALRQTKDPEELDAIVRAVQLADGAMEHIYDWIRPGMTERQVAWELEVIMRTRGAEALSFPIIVASGPNGAMPHHRPGDQIIARGDPVVIDMGALVDGYCSDLTRSFCVGEASEEYLQRWEIVLDAQLKAEGELHGGIAGVSADRIARDVIYSAGYEGQFGHGLGHSVGLAIHEDPRASQVYLGEIPAGVVLTVEPGIYVPGWGGIRIEDMVVLTDKGCRVLTACPKRPVVGA